MFEGKAQVQYHTAWVIAKCDDGILEFYRWLYWKRYHIKLMRPMAGAHISLVRGEEEGIIKGNWERNLEGQIITFKYAGEIVDVKNYVWMHVYGDDLYRIRRELGFSDPIKSFHMTIGRTD
jgi:hypothetical protein